MSDWPTGQEGWDAHAAGVVQRFPLVASDIREHRRRRQLGLYETGPAEPAPAEEIAEPEQERLF